jgi:hypothetical protein
VSSSRSAGSPRTPTSASAATALLVATVLALFGASPAVARDVSFRTPSANIVCLYSSSGGPGPNIRCDVLSLNDTGFFLDRRHKAKRIRVTDTVYDVDARVLRYGTSRRFGPFRCHSRRTGLTCRSASRHGFELSRERQRVF